MRIKYSVTIASENADGKVIENVVETDSMVGAMRIMKTFQAKRGYKPFYWLVEEVAVMDV